MPVNFIRKVFLFLFSVWILLFSYIDIKKLAKKFNSEPVVNDTALQDTADDSLKKLAYELKSAASKEDDVLFVSPEGFSFTKFNLEVYPIVTKWARAVEDEDLSQWDILVFYDHNSLVKNAVIKTHDY